MRYLNFPIFEFVIASTITYIFYYQAKELKLEIEERQRDHLEGLKEETEADFEEEEDLNAYTGLVNLSRHTNNSQIQASRSQMQQITLKLLK